MNAMEFRAFPKMSRLTREVIVTEKIDGTNACIFIGEALAAARQSVANALPLITAASEGGRRQEGTPT